VDIPNLKRDAEYVKGTLEVLGDTIVTRTGCKIHIPVHYQESNLMQIGAENYILGIFAVIVDDAKYCVNSAITMMRIDPTFMSTFKYDDTEYYEFYFEPGSVVFSNTMVMVNDVVAYYVYDEFVAKGRIPWYMTYADMGKLFASSGQYAGISIGANRAVMEMMIASIARNPKDLTQYYRHYRNESTDPELPTWVPGSSVIYGATNTTAKIIGSYFDLAVVSALNNPSTRTERIEDILRR
jgi:hypothetical protein